MPRVARRNQASVRVAVERVVRDALSDGDRVERRATDAACIAVDLADAFAIGAHAAASPVRREHGSLVGVGAGDQRHLGGFAVGERSLAVLRHEPAVDRDQRRKPMTRLGDDIRGGDPAQRGERWCRRSRRELRRPAQPVVLGAGTERRCAVEVSDVALGDPGALGDGAVEEPGGARATSAARGRWCRPRTRRRW